MIHARLFLYYMLYIVTILSITSCKKANEVGKILTTVEQAIEQYPDSSLVLLSSIADPYDLSPKHLNKYWLLQIQAKDKAYKDITSDTIIFHVKDYYIQKQDYLNAAKAIFYCGRVLHEQKKLEKAADVYLQAIEWSGKTKDYNLKGLIYGNLGILYEENSLYEKAIALNKKAVEMYEQIKNNRNKISALKTIGDCFLLSEKTDSAFYYYNQCLTLADSCKTIDLQSNIRQSIGLAYREKGDYAQAKRFFIEASAFPVDSVEQLRIRLNITQVFVLENQMDSAKFYLDQILSYSIQDPWLLRSSHLLLSRIEEENHRYREALKYYKDYYQATIKLLNEKKK